MRCKIEQMQHEVNEFMQYVKHELARGLDDWEQRLSTAARQVLANRSRPVAESAGRFAVVNVVDVVDVVPRRRERYRAVGAKTIIKSGSAARIIDAVSVVRWHGLETDRRRRRAGGWSAATAGAIRLATSVSPRRTSPSGINTARSATSGRITNRSSAPWRRPAASPRRIRLSAAACSSKVSQASVRRTWRPPS